MTDSIDTCAACGLAIDFSTAMVGFWTPPWSMVAGLVSACGPGCFDTLEAEGWHPATDAEKSRLLADARRYGRRIEESELPDTGP